MIDQLIGGLNYWLTNLFNLPARGLIILCRKLMSSDVSVESFHSLWQAIAYIVSFFYLILLVYAGFKMIVSSDEERANAKRMLSNTVVMIIMVQLSFWLYSVSVEMSANLSSAIFSLIPDSFFTIGLSGMVMMAVYLVILILTAVLLCVRYIIVAFGVAVIPVAFALYYFEPTKGYGKLLLNVIFAFVFVPFFQALILLSASMIPIEMYIMESLLLVSAFVLADLVMIGITAFVIVKSANSVMNSGAVNIVKRIHVQKTEGIDKAQSRIGDYG